MQRRALAPRVKTSRAQCLNLERLEPSERRRQFPDNYDRYKVTVLGLRRLPGRQLEFAINREGGFTDALDDMENALSGSLKLLCSRSPLGGVARRLSLGNFQPALKLTPLSPENSNSEMYSITRPLNDLAKIVGSRRLTGQGIH
jgi:hypothetical protein